MSLAQKHRDRVLAMQAASAPAIGGGLTPSTPNRPTPVNSAAAQIRLRFVHDLRRLKEIKSTEVRVAAKRQMLPEYRSWCDGWLEAGRCTVGRELGLSGADDVLPTVMVWSIDIGDWSRALELAAHVLRFRIAMPDRYKRDAATLVVEEIAEAAIRAQARSQEFPLSVLEQVEELTAGIDMHDEVQAKLQKALGVELARLAGEVDTGADDFVTAATRALEPLRRAQELNPRAGTKTKVGQLEKAIKAALAVKEQAGTAG